MRLCTFLSLLTFHAALFGALTTTGGCNLPDPPKKVADIPSEYAEKHMPENWWNDQAIIEEGRLIYVGSQKPGVNCAKCHGKNGKPVKSGARDFRNQSSMKKYSDSHLLWRISEGVPFSTMKAYKGRLSEEEVWKVIAFVASLGLQGWEYDSVSRKWIFQGRENIKAGLI